jgi:uncharacterized protein (TIGR02271 family)
MPAANRASPDSMQDRTQAPETGETRAVPLFAEELHVTRERVATGSVRIDKRVVRRTEHVDEPVMEERVEVERRAVNRIVDAPPPVRQEGDTLIIPLLEEVLIVEKRLVVREELHVKRVRDQSRVRQDVTLESEHANVERIDGPPTGRSTRMDRTVVAVFERREQAQAVREELLRAGVPETLVHVREDDEDSMIGDAPGDSSRTDDEDRKPGFFERLFGGLDADDDHASRYSDAVTHGHFVVVVDCIPEERIEDATRIMASHGAIDVDERVIGWRGGSSGESMTQRAGDAIARGGERIAEALTPDDDSRTGAMPDSGRDRMAAASTAGRGMDETTRIPVVEEQLEVGKRQVQRGGVRVYTRLAERPVQEQVTLREEHARVERRAVDRPASEADLGAAFQEGSIEVVETAEVPVVNKTARVVEEVEIGKEISERTEVVDETVRRTEVEVEDLAAAASQPRKGDVRPNR